MACESDCFPEYCLSCDRQCTEGPYCSQACRTADFERSGSPRPSHTPYSTLSTPTSASSSWSSAGFHLPPALDFHCYRPSQESAALPRRSSDLSSYRASKRSSVSSLDHIYTPSDSRVASTITLTESTRQQLQQYERSFDSSRRKKQQLQRSL